jgi:hypothetical protein
MKTATKTASTESVCSFCWQKVAWKNYAKHLDKHHRHGAVISPLSRPKKKLIDLVGPDFVVDNPQDLIS